MVAFLLAVAGLGLATAESPTVLVTGATGRTGALLYSWLKENHVTVRAFVRNATKAREVLGCSKCDESEGIFVGDVTKKETLLPAMQGATALALTTSAVPICKGGQSGPPECSYPKGGYPIDVDFHGGRAQVDAFGEATKGAGRIVMCSSMGTTEPDSFLEKLGNGHIGFFKLNAEAFIMDSGMPFTIVKPCGLTNDPASKRELLVGHDDGLKVDPPLVPRADVARVMGEALVHPEEAAGLRFDLCSRPGTPSVDLGPVFSAARYSWQAGAGESREIHV
jgi:nucleoside-diphosphate-sugar epimerase